MISWAFVLCTLGAVIFAAYVTSLRVAVLSLWIAGLAIGGLYLTLGAELLAVIQWIVSTLVAISLIFFSAMFGEAPEPAQRMDLKVVLRVAAPVLLGLGFATVVWVGAGLPGMEVPAPSAEGADLAALGRELVENHLISLEVLALTLFLVLVGGGIVARPHDRTRGDKREAPSC